MNPHRSLPYREPACAIAAPAKRRLRGTAAVLLLAAAAMGASPVAASGPAQGTTSGAIASARYAAPVEHYGHFALGRPHEYASLDVVTGDGRRLRLTLPPGQVFEDLQPRLVTMAPGAPTELLTIVSDRRTGSRLALVGLRDGRLEIGAQSRPIGQPMRWLNPVGVADLDGDGSAEVAAVLTPHIGGTLVVYRREAGRLVPAASLPGFSNHVYGAAQLGLSTVIAVDGRPQLLVPDITRTVLRVVRLDAGRLLETGRCPLAEPLQRDLRVVPPAGVRVDGSANAVEIPKDCQR